MLILGCFKSYLQTENPNYHLYQIYHSELNCEHIDQIYCDIGTDEALYDWLPW